MTLNFNFRATKKRNPNPELQRGSIQGRVHIKDSKIISTFRTKIFCIRKEWDEISQTLKKKQHTDNAVLNDIRKELNDLWHLLNAEINRKRQSGVVCGDLSPKELIRAFNPKKSDLIPQKENSLQNLLDVFVETQQKRLKQEQISERTLKNTYFLRNVFSSFLKENKILLAFAIVRKYRFYNLFLFLRKIFYFFVIWHKVLDL
jgi:hypothetical protein